MISFARCSLVSTFVVRVAPSRDAFVDSESDSNIATCSALTFPLISLALLECGLVRRSEDSFIKSNIKSLVAFVQERIIR